MDVYNGGSTQGLAGQVSAALVKDGYKAGQIGNTGALTTTQVLYGTGSAASASKIASLFGVTATASSTVAAGHVQVMLGANATRARRQRHASTVLELGGCPSPPRARRAAPSTRRTAFPASTE